MGLHDLKPAEGSRKARKRIGRGPGSGTGKTAGKGHKGHKARSGGSTRLGFEGGQNPLYRRLPKRGFGNGLFRKSWMTINVGELNELAAGSVVDVESLVASGTINRDRAAEGLKVLGEGDLKVALTVRAGKFSKSALEKIQAAGGTAEVI